MFKKLFPLLFVLTAGYFLYSALNVPPPPNKVVVAPRVAVPPAAVSPAPESQFISSDWPGIQQDKNLTVLEDKLTRRNVVLIFDGSASMAESRCSGSRTKSNVAKDAVKDWASSVPADANLGLIVFDETGLSVRLPLGLNNRDRFRHEIAKIVPNYKTPLTKSLYGAYEMLTEQGRKQLGYGEYTIVIVTDGVANNPDALMRAVNSTLIRSPIMISTIGFCIRTNHSLNQPGKTVYKAANNPEALRQGLQEVLAESESFDISAFQ